MTRINKIQPTAKVKILKENPDVKLFHQGNYLLKVETYSYKQIRSIIKLSDTKIVSREVIHFNHSK